MRNRENDEVWIFLLAKFFVPILAVLTFIVISIINCADDTDPMDRGWTSIEHLCNLHVTDNRGNGFRIAYVTSKGVTPERAKEIRSRQPVIDAWERLQAEAAEHFGGSLLYTDIYDFATFAKKYDVDPDIEIHCIFVMGGRCDFYAGPNPNIPNSAKYIDPNTEQGVLWINHSDVVHSHITQHRTYRYWRCPGLYETSKTDEHFSHFSEDERIH